MSIRIITSNKEAYSLVVDAEYNGETYLQRFGQYPSQTAIALLVIQAVTKVKERMNDPEYYRALGAVPRSDVPIDVHDVMELVRDEVRRISSMKCEEPGTTRAVGKFLRELKGKRLDAGLFDFVELTIAWLDTPSRQKRSE